MPFQIEKTFVIRAPPEAVWRFLTDPQRVARCLPGAAITSKLGDQSYAGTLAVTGPTFTASVPAKLPSSTRPVMAAPGRQRATRSGSVRKRQTASGGARTTKVLSIWTGMVRP